MNTIRNLHKISGLLSPEQVNKLEAGANLHLRHSNIGFKIIEVNDKELHVRSAQGKPFSENIADNKTLITRTRELFGPFFPGRTIYTHPVPYKTAIVEVVTPEWLSREMLDCEIKVKDFVELTGIDKSNISAWINGIRPMSQIVKAMFFNIVLQFAIKRFVKWLNQDISHSAIFTLKKYFDREFVETLVYTNTNATRYDIDFSESDTIYCISLTVKAED